MHELEWNGQISDHMLKSKAHLVGLAFSYVARKVTSISQQAMWERTELCSRISEMATDVYFIAACLFCELL